MDDQQQLTIRFPRVLLERIDGFNEDSLQGAGLRRATVIKLLITKALNAEDKSNERERQSA